MQNNHDFGFNTEEFLLPSTPYAQFINASDKKFGIAITSSNAELAKFELIRTLAKVFRGIISVFVIFGDWRSRFY